MKLSKFNIDDIIKIYNSGKKIKLYTSMVTFEYNDDNMINGLNKTVEKVLSNNNIDFNVMEQEKPFPILTNSFSISLYAYTVGSDVDFATNKFQHICDEIVNKLSSRFSNIHYSKMEIANNLDTSYIDNITDLELEEIESIYKDIKKQTY